MAHASFFHERFSDNDVSGVNYGSRMYLELTPKRGADVD